MSKDYRVKKNGESLLPTQAEIEVFLIRKKKLEEEGKV